MSPDQIGLEESRKNYAMIYNYPYNSKRLNTYAMRIPSILQVDAVNKAGAVPVNVIIAVRYMVVLVEKLFTREQDQH